MTYGPWRKFFDLGIPLIVGTLIVGAFIVGQRYGMAVPNAFGSCAITAFALAFCVFIFGGMVHEGSCEDIEDEWGTTVLAAAFAGAGMSVVAVSLTSPAIVTISVVIVCTLVIGLAVFVFHSDVDEDLYWFWRRILLMIALVGASYADVYENRTRAIEVLLVIAAVHIVWTIVRWPRKTIPRPDRKAAKT